MIGFFFCFEDGGEMFLFRDIAERRYADLGNPEHSEKEYGFLKLLGVEKEALKTIQKEKESLVIRRIKLLCAATLMTGDREYLKDAELCLESIQNREKSKKTF